MKKVYIVAAIAAIAIGIFAWLLGTSISAANRVDKAEVDVTVAVSDIKAGTRITPEMVQVVKINNKAVLPGAYSTTECVGLIANSDIFAQEQITSVKVVSQEQMSYGRLSYKLEEGYRAISLAVDATTSVSGFVRGGDLVDILYTVQTKKATSNDMFEAATEVLFEKCNVIAVGGYTANQGEDAGEYSTVTLSMPTEEAMKLASYVYTIANGSANPSKEDKKEGGEQIDDDEVPGIGGKLMLVLRNPEDDTTTTAVIKNVN